MKKIIAITLLILTLFVCSAKAPTIQYTGKFYPAPGTVPTTNITVNATQNGWAQLGQACSGCPSLWYQITRTYSPYQAEDGAYYFYYYFYFYSNSYYPNGMVGATYLTDVNFISDGATVIYSPYLLIEAGEQKFGAWIRTRNPGAMVSFNISKMSVF